MDEQKKLIEKLREQYIKNPPEGMTSSDDLLDMSYFLNEDLYDDDVGEEGFYIF